jgi:hypothetical protein
MPIDLGTLLSQFVNTTGDAKSQPTADEATGHFEQAAQSASPDLLSQGLAAMFRSDDTPPFAQTVGQLFGQASPNQQAGILNQLLSSVGPTVLASLLGGAAGGTAGGGLASILGQAAPRDGSAPTPITPEQASALTPDQVTQIASHAEQQNPDIVEQMSAFYAEHAGLIKTLGGAALTVVLAKMAEAHRG